MRTLNAAHGEIMPTETTVKQFYKLLSSYHRTGRLEFKWAVQRQGDDLREFVNSTEVTASARERRIIRTFTITFATLCLTTFFCVRQEMLYVRREMTRSQKAIELLNADNTVFAVGKDWYAIIEKDNIPDNVQGCRQFIAGKVESFSNNNRPAFVTAEKEIRFTIPEGCKP